MNKINKYAFKETKNTLSSRVDSHHKFSNFSLHDWIAKNFDFDPGDKIFDIGCGDGNFTGLFWDMLKHKGTIIGSDKNPDLIEKAKSRYSNISSNSIGFHVADFDHPINIENQFNWMFSIYSIYYVSDAKVLIEKLYKHLVDGGQMVLIGPGVDNGKQMEEVNYSITGKLPDDTYVERLKRLKEEFRPLLADIFGDDRVKLTEINTQMSFPTTIDFTNYYWSSMLWRNSIDNLSGEKISSLKNSTLEKVDLMLPFNLDKQLVCVRAIKN